MRDLLILGNGVHAAEMAEIVDRVNRVEPTWNLLGFVSHNGENVGEMLNGYKVLGAQEVLEQYAGACLVKAFEWPRKAEVPRERLVSLIDPTAVVSCTAQIGAGCVVGMGAVVVKDVPPNSVMAGNPAQRLRDNVTYT